MARGRAWVCAMMVSNSAKFTGQLEAPTSTVMPGTGLAMVCIQS